MKRVSVSVVKKICFILLGLMFISLFVSCEYFNYDADFDVAESVIERLDKASFEEFAEAYKNDSTGLLNKNGERCISYSTTNVISSQIRNPRNYSLDVKYTPTDGSNIDWIVCDSIRTLEEKNPNSYDIAMVLDDSGRFLVRFSSYFLHSREVLLDKRNISGTLTLYGKNNGREFDKREISFRVNTPPPAIPEADPDSPDTFMLQRNADGTKYILCFMLPKPASVDVVHEIDTHAFSMNGSLVYFDIDSRSFYTDYTDAEMKNPAESYSSERPSGIRPLKDDGELFVESDLENCIPVYYDTGVEVTTATKIWEIFLQDDEGLKSTEVQVSNNERALTAPSFTNAENNGEYVANTSDGYFTLMIGHDGKCLDGESAGSNISFVYIIRDEDGNVVKESTSTSREIKLPRGNYSEIELYAKKNRYTPSDRVFLRNITVSHSAVIPSFDFGNSVRNKDRLDCIPSDDDAVISAHMTNAFAEEIDVQYELNNTQGYNQGDIVCSCNNSGDIEITFSEDFLKRRERNNRDISGNILISERSTEDLYRTCAPFPVTLRVNTPPPAFDEVADKVMLQRDSTGTKYVLCFMMPKLEEINPVYEDTHIIYINSAKFYYNSNNFDGSFYTDAEKTTLSTVFTATRPQGLRPLKDDSELFPANATSNHVPVYYMTNINVTETEKLWSIFLRDDENLDSDTITVSNIKRTLEIPALESVNSLANGQTYWLNDDGEFNVSFSHSLHCIDHTEVEDSVEIYLNTYDESGERLSSVYETASTNQNARFSIPRGHYAAIKIYAKKDGYWSSDYLSFTNITVKQHTVFYVSSSGSDSNVGTSNKPFNTVNKAVNNFLENFEENSCTINLVTNNMSQVTVPNGAAGKTITINGNNHTINVGGNGKVITINGGTVNLSNLTVTGGSAENGAGLYISGESIVTLNNCSVVVNTASGNGGAIYIEDNASVTLASSIVIENTAESNGGGLYACEDATVTLSGGSIVANNAAGENGGGLYACGDAGVTLTNSYVNDNGAVENGGGLYVCDDASVALLGGSVEENEAEANGGGLYVCDDASVTLTGSTVEENEAEDNGGGIYIEDNASVSLTGDSSVTENNAGGTGAGAGAGVYNNGTLKVSGKVTIKDNKCGTLLTTQKPNNVYLCEDKYITVTGSIDTRSEIHISTSGQLNPGDDPIVFTSGFSTYNSSVSQTTASTIFKSDKKFAISISEGELTVSNNGGSFIIDPLDGTLTLTFTASATGSSSVSSFTAGTATPIYVKAMTDGNAVVPPGSITYTFTFKTFDGDFIANLTPTVSGNFAVVTIPATRASGRALLPDTYKLYVTARYNDVTHNRTLTLEGVENSSSGGVVPNGFVAVTGATVSGAVGSGDAASSVFIAGRTVTIPNMYVSDHEVTQKEWYDVFNVTQETMDSEHNNGRGNNYPVYSVNWYGAIAYCNKKSVADGLTPCYSVSGIPNWANLAYSSIPTSNNETWNAATCDFNANGYRLPTDAEWEYIARGGNNGIPTTQTTYSGSNTISNVAWYGLNGGTSGGTAHVVKGKTPNSRGVYDMSGNVWELCWDWYSTSITTSTSSTGVSEGTDRVVRGGSWSNSESDCTVATRWPAPGNFVANDCIGFRVVRTAQ